MESLSRPLHSRKLSNATSFSAKNAYHGVFSGHRHNYAGPPGIDVQDYREIFATSSSIPVLDLSTLGEPADASSLSSNTRSSKPDYCKIFGGFRDEEVAVSYEELFACDKARAPSSTRSTSQDSDDLSYRSSDTLKQFNMSYHKISPKSKDGLDGTRHVTQLHAIPGFTCFIDEAAPPPKMEAKKHKSSAVDVSVDSSKEGFAEKQPSENAVRRKSKPHPGKSFSEDKFSKTFEIGLKPHPSTVLPPSASSTNVDNHKTYSKISTAINSESCKTDASESADARFSPTYFHEELDVNSAAAASAAALRKAIEKAQESIRIAKESVGRKKKGLRSFSSKCVKESFKVDGRREDVTAGEEHKCKDEVGGVFERVAAPSQAFPDLGRNRKYGGTVVFPDFLDGEKLFVAKKVIDEMNGKISESTKECSIPIQSPNIFKDSTIVSNSKQVTSETESRPLDSAAKDEHLTLSSEAVDTENSRTDTPDFVHADQTNNISVDDYEGKIKQTKPTAGVLEHQGVVKEPESVERAYELEEVGKQDAVRIAQGWEGGEGTLKSALFLHEGRENDTCAAPQEDGASAQRPQGFLKTVEDDKSRESLENKEEVGPSNSHELAKGSDNLTAQEVEDEKKESQESNQNDNVKGLNETLGLLENEKQEVLEQEHVENFENEEMHRKKNNEASDEGIKEASQWLESENESKDDQKTKSHKEVESREMFYDVCELETKDSAQTRVNSIEEIDVTLQDDCEMKHEDNHTGERKRENLDEACDHKFDENSSGDDSLTEETDNVDDTQESWEINMNNKNVETTQEADDVGSSPVHVTEASCEFQVEDTEAIKGVDALEGEFFEKTYSDQTISDDNEDECEMKYDNLADLGSADTGFGQNETEEVDVRSESSSGTVRGVEEEADESNREKNTIDEEKIVPREEKESNILLPHKEMPRVGSINEIKASKEPRVSNETEKSMDVTEEIRTSQYREKEDKIGETGGRKLAGKEHRKKWHEIDEVTAREREREKNRLAVDRAIREARERAFAETRERAERAAVEKATEEVRKRMMADAREKAAKASVGTKSSSERTAQSKLRAERAAVERATSEARQRALEKAISQKSVSEAGDLHSSNGTSTESALRSKAKLEKHNRIMENVAKALAEKEKRDLLAQKEQAERNRLAENLDADIKRWSSGKEGNLRALLSTLQYILGPDSGWQAVSLTEIISSSAVKKAYRKATLCVHPDKLQQRGASVQHKYICEKVFDLLKAAWNRFNSEER
ncbi:hypothetical protein L6452_39308 [Arctium lappa]|uniref:Uncharacterized protein n=1 Tax=Arctium lappa TaxID=4217 RepID=A0ACB8XRA3_ARCLA|nr:hypothetical protein L6452_39308 [Arctium lappa]